jgi:hypothetical protein
VMITILFLNAPDTLHHVAYKYVQWIVEASSSYRGFNQTTGTINKVVCHDGKGNDSLFDNI